MWCDVVTSVEMWCLPRKMLQPYHKVLQYSYKVLHSITKYYSILQSATVHWGVLLRIRKYYKFLLILRATKYYSVLQSITKYYTVYYKVLLGTTKYYEVLQSATPLHMKRPVHCAEQTWHSCLIAATHETTSPLRKATHRIENTMELRHSPVVVVAHETSSTWRRATYGMQKTKAVRYACLLAATHETFSALHGETGVTLQHPLRLPRKMTVQVHQILPLSRKMNPQGTTTCNVISKAWTIRDRSENDPTMNSSSRTHPFADITLTFQHHQMLVAHGCACHEKWHSDITKCCACHEKWYCNITKYWACHEKSHYNL